MKWFLLSAVLLVQTQEIDSVRSSGGLLFSTRVDEGVLVESHFEVSEQDVRGRHEKRRVWKNHELIRFTLEKYQGSGLHRAHVRAISLTSKIDGSKTNTTLNCVAAYPRVNQVQMRLVEKYIESVAPCSVKFEAKYDGTGRFIDGSEVPDSFVYTINSDGMSSRFVIQNNP